MTTVHLATVGHTIEPIIDGFRHFSVDHQILLHSSETLDEATEVRERILRLSRTVQCELEEINAFDLNDVFRAIIQPWKERLPDSEFFINITGGTNIMAAAALVAGFAIGARVYYFREPMEANESLATRLVELPVPKVPLENLGDSQQRFLKTLSQRGGPLTLANSTIADAIGESRQIVGYHLRELERKGLIRQAEGGRGKTATLTTEGELFAALIQDTGEETSTNEKDGRRRPRRSHSKK